MDSNHNTESASKNQNNVSPPSSDERIPNPHYWRNPKISQLLENYWKKNIKIMGILLAVWAFVSLGCGILFADILNNIKIGGFPLGFWFAQQGSIMVFVFLILVYCILLNRLDRQHHNELEAIKQEGEANS